MEKVKESKDLGIVLCKDGRTKAEIRERTVTDTQVIGELKNYERKVCRYGS